VRACVRARVHDIITAELQLVQSELQMKLMLK